MSVESQYQDTGETLNSSSSDVILNYYYMDGNALVIPSSSSSSGWSGKIQSLLLVKVQGLEISKAQGI